jgi:lipopolysaccharide transport system permease protein
MHSGHRSSKAILVREWLTSPFIFRSLIKGFVRQDILGRFAGSMGGLFWTVLTPLANIVIFWFVFSTIFRARISIEEVGTDSFFIYLLSGLIPWMAFSEAVGRSTTLLLDKTSIITKVSFPVQVLPYAGVMVPFILNGVSMVIFLIYLSFKGYAHISWLWLPVVTLLFFALTMGLCAFLSAVSVFLRDIQQMIAVVISLWFYLTPIIYPLSLVPEAYRKWFSVNFVAVFVELFREILLRHEISVPSLSLAFVLSAVFFLSGGYFFMRIRHAFGDVL